MSCPHPPRYCPGPPESVNSSFFQNTTGETDSDTSTEPGIELVGKGQQWTPSSVLLAPIPPLKNCISEKGRIDPSTPEKNDMY